VRWLTAVGVLVAAMAVPEIARAQVTVNSFTDAAPPGPCTPELGGCTLREALVSTADSTIVNLPAGAYHVSEGALPAGGSRFLVGAGARTTTITADFLSRVMTVTAGDMSIRGVTITGGNVVEAPGGGIFVSPGTELNLFDSTVTDNTAETGGGIYSEGTLRVERSAITLNFAEGGTPLGGGLAVGEGGDADLLDTTISGNYSDSTGAGLYTTGNVEMHNVTIARNISDSPSPSGGGIQQSFDDDTDVTVAFNTLVVENEGGNCLGTSGDDQIQARFSMSDDPQVCNVPQDPQFGNTPIAANSAGLGELGNHGGPTDTHDLASDSPALGEAEEGSCEGKFDQRGLARDLGGACDIGAYERADELSVTTQSDQSDDVCMESGCSLREAINLVADEGEVEVPQGNYVLTRGQLNVTSEVVVRGVGARATTFTAGTNARVMSVTDGFVTLIGVRITGGNVAVGQNPLGSIGGGIAVIDGGLSLLDSAVNNNVAGRGGGIFVADGGVVLTDTTVSANQAIDSEIGSGGGLYLDQSLGQIASSTISGNSARTIGGGIMTVGSRLEMASVTLAANSLLGQGSGSAIYRAVILDDTVEIGETVAHNTLIAGNPGMDCGGSGPFDVTSVMTDHASCPGQLVGDALIGDLADNGGDTDTHQLLAGSPAIDSGANCGLFDQRGEPRPQGLACDVGAFEGDGGDPSSLRVTTTVVNNDGGSAEADDFLVHVRRGTTDVPGSPQPGSGQGTEYVLPAGDYVVSGDVGGSRYAVAVGGDCGSGGGITLPEDVSRSCTVTFDDIAQPPAGGGGGGGAAARQDPQPLPEPEAGEEVNALPVSGTVRVREPGSNRFVELQEGQQIPVGSVIDVTDGRVTIVAAGGQSADFYGGIFRLGQGKGAKPLTTLTLVEALSCPKAGKAAAAAKKKKRRLWGDGSGRFRTKGKHSAATVVGTRWLVEDKCTSTTTRVARGRVSVRDFARKKTVIVKAGKKYVARARR
jgi:CSLREA domain-containing protein